MAGRKPTISDAEILSVFVRSDDPAFSTSEIRDAIGFNTNGGTIKRLKALEEEGYVGVKKPDNARLWWITEEGREYVRSQLGNDSL